MDPHIFRQLDIDGRERIAVTGTPGIGKSVYGALLARSFIRNESSVVYWRNDRVFLFSWDADVTKSYGLSRLATDGNKTLSAGLWEKTESIGFATLLSDKRVVVIHDPKAKYLSVALDAHTIQKIIFIVSYGHDLIGHWASKDLAPHLYLYLPVWTFPEATNAAQLLSFIEHNNVKELFRKFGGSIRCWRASLEEEMEKSFREKVKDVVKKHGDDLLGRTIDTRGSIVHMAVEFDASKSILPYPLKRPNSKDGSAPPAGMSGGVDEDCDTKMAAVSDAQSAAASVTNQGNEANGNYNNFGEYDFVFGSEMILRAIDAAITSGGEEALKLCLHTWASEPGYESIYGGLFELRCHRIISKVGSKGRQLRVRRVFSDGRVSEIQAIALLGVGATVRYKGNDPKCLCDSEYDGMFGVNSYFWPYSSNHPTYDAAMLVDGAIGGESSKPIVALLFQMTVSGASGLPRRPNHVMKQHVRKEFDNTFFKQMKNYTKDSAITAFVVPTECFEAFDFQPETLKNDDDTETQKQPQYQLVIEMPGIFSLSDQTKDYLALEDVSASHKRKHRYTLRG